MEAEKFSYYGPANLETVFSGTFDIYRRHFGWLFFITFLALLLSLPAVSHYSIGNMSALYDIENNDLSKLAEIYKNAGILVLVSLVIQTFIHLFVVNYVFHKESGSEAGLGTILAQTVGRFLLPGMIVMVIVIMAFTVGTVLGLLALIIGSLFALLFLATVFFPVLPVLVVERTGIFRTIGRSFRLVMNDFWHTLGYILLFLLFYIMASMILSTLTMIPYAGRFIREIFTAMSQPAPDSSGILSFMTNPVYLGLNSLVSALITPLMPIFSLLIYFRLRYLDDEKQKRSQTTMEHPEDDTRDLLQ